MKNLFKKNEEQNEIVINKLIKLKITLKNNSWFFWETEYDEKHSFMWHWFDFYRWYFCREQSENYMFKYKQGETLIKRSEILTFQVKVE